jgi:hypothetical protein
MMVGGLAALAVLSFALGMAHNRSALLGPAELLLFAIGIVFYLLPTGLALYRDCASSAWIAALNVLLGWTVFGWVIAIGWATVGKTRPMIVPRIAASH